MALQGFDKDYYLNAKLAQLQSQDSAAWGSHTAASFEAFLTAAGFTAESHYMAYGWAEGLEPNAYFNHTEYVRAKAVQMHATGGYNNVLEAEAAFRAAWGGDAYQHYILYGSKEGIDPSSSFDESAYLTAKLTQLQTADAATWGSATISDVRAAIAGAGMTTLSHYLAYAEAEGIGGSYPVATTYTLTNSPDLATANVFNAPRVWNPDGSDTMNSLDDNDVLNGTGTNPTLNFTYSNDTETGDYSIMPTLRGIETINVAYDTNALGGVADLDLQDSTGLTTLNLSRIDDGLGAAQVDNITSALTSLSISNSNAPGAIVRVLHLDAAVNGTADAVALALNNVNVAQLTLEEVALADQGYETINLTSSQSANSLGLLQAEDLQTLNVAGDQNFTLGTTAAVFNGGLVEATHYTAGLANVAGSMSALNASTFTGVLDVTMGGELNAFADSTSGVPVNFTLTGGTGNDVFRFATGTNLDAGDTIDGGAGEGETNTMIIHGPSNIRGTVNNVQALEIRSGHDAAAAADAVTINTTTASSFGHLATTLIRNEGQATVGGVWFSAAEALATTLNSYTDAQAAAITYLHGTTGNNGIANNALTVDFATNAATNVVGLTFADASNTDLRFNMQLTSAEANGLTITDNDTESNTIGLNSFAALDGTITLTGGEAGDFFNFDRTDNSYGYDQTGGTADQTAAVAAAFTGAPFVVAQSSARDTAVDMTFFSGAGAAAAELLRTPTITAGEYVGDVVLRVGQANQTITTGTGDDTVIFADRGATSTTLSESGLTIQDTVAMGTGTDTIVLDGTGAIAVGASEWTNLTGVDVLRLAGVAGSTFDVQITDQFVDQTDGGSNLVIINNDGDLRTAVAGAENAAEIDITSLSAVNGITFIGPNGDGSIANGNIQTVVVDDVTANGRSTLNGGDRDIVSVYNTTTFATQALADAAYLANVAANIDGNDNIYKIVSSGTNAEVTVGDLANVSNFSHIQWENDDAVSRDLSITLDSTTVGAMVDANHTASATAVETLRIESVDSQTVAGATADLNVSAATVSSAYSLHVMASRGTDNIVTGAGADVVVMAGNYAAGVYGVDGAAGGNTGYDINGRANGVAGALVVNDTINLGGGADELVTYGAINLAGATLTSIETLTFLSDVTVNASDLLAATDINFGGGNNHTLNIVNDLTAGQALDLSTIDLLDTGNLAITLNGTATINTIDASAGTGTVTIDGTVIDTTAPVFQGAAVNGVSLTMAYDEALNAGAAPVAGNFAVMVNGTAVAVNAVAVAGTDVNLTLASAVSQGDTVTVAYTDPTTGNDALAIQDASGNDAATIAAQTVTNNTPAADTTAPTFQSAAVDGATLTMTYDEALSATGPAAGNFTVEVNGTAATVNSVAINGATAVLTLASAVASTDTVTVAYGDPTTGDDANAIQDAAGNDAASISGQAVTNNTAPVGGNVTVDATTAAAALDATGGDYTYQIAQATYTQEITGFAANDVLDFPAGNNPTVNNTSYTDGMVEVQFALSGTVTTIQLTGLDAATDQQLNGVADFDTVFGAGTII